MNPRSIALIKYIIDPTNDKTYLFLQSSELGKLYERLKFPIRTYSREEYSELLSNFEGYLVRGISIDDCHDFISRDGEKRRVYTQKCAKSSILMKDSEYNSAINISHIRGSKIAEGFKYQIKPLPVGKERQLMSIYCEGVMEYYTCLKKHAELQEKWNKNLDKKVALK